MVRGAVPGQFFLDMTRYLLFFLLLAACTPEKEPEMQVMDSPAGPDSETPNLIEGADGNTYLTWVEPEDTLDVLKYSKWEGSEWGEARTIAKGYDWFTNWADFPTMGVNTEGKMMASFLAKSAASTYAYDVYLTFSEDGLDWSIPFLLNTDSTATEHGFVTILTTPANNFRVAWLDGRKSGYDTGEEGGAMTIRTAEFDPAGMRLSEVELDDRVCDCCQTSGTMIREQAVFVYRDRSEKEIRDIGIVSGKADRFSEPKIIAEDQWEISACPVNGPAIHSRKNSTVIAWYTGAGEEPKVNVAISTDDGNTFGEAIRIDNGDPLGRVGITSTERAFTVSWLENGDPEGKIMVAWIGEDGQILNKFSVTSTSTERRSGFPQIQSIEDGLLLAWTEFNKGKTSVKTGRIEF